METDQLAYKDYAIKITPHNMLKIKAQNGNSLFMVDALKGYFIYSEDPRKTTLVLPNHIFKRCFRFRNAGGQERSEKEFVEVQEIN